MGKGKEKEMKAGRGKGGAKRKKERKGRDGKEMTEEKVEEKAVCLNQAV